MAEPLGGALWRTPKAWALRRSRTGCPICRRRHPRDVVATLPASCPAPRLRRGRREATRRRTIRTAPVRGPCLLELRDARREMRCGPLLARQDELRTPREHGPPSPCSYLSAVPRRSVRRRPNRSPSRNVRAVPRGASSHRTGHSECAVPPSKGSVSSSLAETEVRAQTLMSLPVVRAPDGPRRARESDGSSRYRTSHRGLPDLGGREAPSRADHMGRRTGDEEPGRGPHPGRAREKDRRRRRTRGVLAFRGARPAPDRERFLRRPRVAAEGSRAGPGHAPPRGSEGDARGADRSRSDADERDGRDILEIDGIPDGRPHGVRPGHPLESVDHLAVRPERLLSEFLAALGAADPRPRALRVLRLQRPEEL